MNSYSGDLRERVLKKREAGWSAQECARNFHVSKRTVERWWKRWLESGGRQARRIGGGRVSTLKPHEQAVLGWIAQKPDLTLEQICGRLWREKGMRLRKSALAHQLARMGLSYKKKLCAPPSSRAPMCGASGTSGGKRTSAAARGGWSLSTKQA